MGRCPRRRAAIPLPRRAAVAGRPGRPAASSATPIGRAERNQIVALQNVPGRQPAGRTQRAPARAEVHRLGGQTDLLAAAERFDRARRGPHRPRPVGPACSTPRHRPRPASRIEHEMAFVERGAHRDGERHGELVGAVIGQTDRHAERAPERGNRPQVLAAGRDRIRRHAVQQRHAGRAGRLRARHGVRHLVERCHAGRDRPAACRVPAQRRMSSSQMMSPLAIL